jgi:hypothetical protein
MNPQRTIDFNKVQWADYWYENQEGLRLRTKPTVLTVRGVSVLLLGKAASHPDYPSETMEERARRLGIVDRWIPVCHLIFSANRNLTYKGEQAVKVWKQYNSHVYAK